ncbi:hypothetical protein B296_00032521 [Ensete ventricosum]|uniref:Uncharacterized protein n=1 Tax=Ensete ventricosum TaxID=4639 RepID=A0A426ZT01_ENSVE|nr:hypothetical protein B296_00032521 [Ensete ventricosum]
MKVDRFLEHQSITIPIDTGSTNNLMDSKLQLDNEPISSLGIRPDLDDAVGPCREFAMRFIEVIGKLTGSTPGDHQRKTR